MLTVEDRLSAAKTHIKAGRRESAVLLFESIIDQSPNNVQALKELALARLELGDLEAASKLAARAAALAADQPDILEAFARIELLAGNDDKALAIVDHALAIDAAHPACCVMKSGLLSRAGALQEAERLLQRALDMHPDHPDVMAGLSGLYFTNGLVEPALRLGQRALEQGPDRPELIAFVGMQLADIGSHRHALAFLERAHLLQPGNPIYLIKLAEVQTAIGELTEGRRLAQRAVSLFPQSLAAWIAYTRIATYEGDGTKALAAFLTAAKRHPDKKGALLTLAAAYRVNGNVEQALKLVEPLLQMQAALEPPLLAQARSIARDCYLSLGRHERLKSTFPNVDIRTMLGLDGGEASGAADGLKDALAKASLVVDTSLSSLEALTLLRFRPEATGPVDVHAPSHLEQTVDLVENVRFLPGDVPNAARQPISAIPLSYVMATPLAETTDIAGPVPYIRARQDKREVWARSLQHLPRPLVALTWDAHRPGILLEDYKPLLAGFPGTLVSVVWDEARHQLSGWRSIIDAGVHFQSLSDLAAVLSVVDATIGPDSVATHVAGAMGKRSAILTLPSVPWYWRSESGRSVWYPSVSVLSSETFGNWQLLLPELSDRIATFLSEIGDAAGERLAGTLSVADEQTAEIN